MMTTPHADDIEAVQQHLAELQKEGSKKGKADVNKETCLLSLTYKHRRSSMKEKNSPNSCVLLPHWRNILF